MPIKSSYPSLSVHHVSQKVVGDDSWYDCKEKLKITQALLQKQEQLVECLKGEIKALLVDNDQLRYDLLCSNCQKYLDGKQPGDTILALPCPACMGAEGYMKAWSLE